MIVLSISIGGCLIIGSLLLTYGIKHKDPIFCWLGGPVLWLGILDVSENRK